MLKDLHLRIINFSGKLSTGINPANNFELVVMYNGEYIHLTHTEK